MVKIGKSRYCIHTLGGTMMWSWQTESHHQTMKLQQAVPTAAQTIRHFAYHSYSCSTRIEAERRRQLMAVIGDSTSEDEPNETSSTQ
ncbi:hypothetical protein E4U19_001039 [Claviceps sp. Clav32 group G5]|nr:hypothetical protein E4U19_001039 [Claviceps sp. Clav32 group G5]